MRGRFYRKKYTKNNLRRRWITEVKETNIKQPDWKKITILLKRK